MDTEKEGRKRYDANLQSIWASLAFSVLAVANQAYKGVFLILFVRMARKRLDKIFLDKRFCERTKPPLLADRPLNGALNGTRAQTYNWPITAAKLIIPQNS